MRRGRLAAATLAVAMLSAAPMRGQAIEASANALTLQSHTRFASVLGSQAGQWVGGDVAIQFFGLRLSMSGARGALEGTADSVIADRDGRTTTITAAWMPARWLAVGGVAEAKGYDTDVGTRTWLLLGGNVRLTPLLDGEQLEGLLDLTVWPSASIVQGEKMTLAMRATIGVTYRLRSGPVGVRVAYRFERFDFEGAAATARLEQVRGAMAGLVVRYAR